MGEGCGQRRSDAAAPVLVEFASDSGALIPVLQRAQAIHGYLPRVAAPPDRSPV